MTYTIPRDEERGAQENSRSCRNVRVDVGLHQGSARCGGNDVDMTEYLEYWRNALEERKKRVS